MTEYVSVPTTPTEEMLKAGRAHAVPATQAIAPIYAAMVGAAPTPPSPQPVVWRGRRGDYPIGTKAHAFNGGHWIRTERGWKWFCGDTFPSPGPDAFEVEVPLIAPTSPQPVADIIDGPEDARHLAMLVAGKQALFSCSEDPQLEDARKCFNAMLSANPHPVSVAEIVEVLAAVVTSSDAREKALRIPDFSALAKSTSSANAAVEQARSILSRLKSQETSSPPSTVA